MTGQHLRRTCTLLVLLVLAGCHSALFQSAKIKEGGNLTAGLTRADAADASGVSDYSVFIKGEIGREAHRYRFGYSGGLSFIAPFKRRQRDFLGEPDTDIGTYPNEWAGVYPEFKLQIPRRLPLDVAFDARFMGYLPERISLIASRDLVEPVTLYGAVSYIATLNGLAYLGSELKLTSDLSLLIESTMWLHDHRYPDDYTGRAVSRPVTVGLAISYHLPPLARTVDPRTAMR